MVATKKELIPESKGSNFREISGADMCSVETKALHNGVAWTEGNE
jgi:hypothetical protein